MLLSVEYLAGDDDGTQLPIQLRSPNHKSKAGCVEPDLDSLRGLYADPSALLGDRALPGGDMAKAIIDDVTVGLQSA